MLTDDADQQKAPWADTALADEFGLSITEFIEVFGARWRALQDLPDDHGPMPASGVDDLPPWYVSGDPPQLMLRVHDHSYDLAYPTGTWAAGTHGLTYRPRDQHSLPVDDLDQAEPIIHELVTKRRRSFRYCRYCRRLTPPELRDSSGECMECASVYHGTVY